MFVAFFIAFCALAQRPSFYAVIQDITAKVKDKTLIPKYNFIETKGYRGHRSCQVFNNTEDGTLNFAIDNHISWVYDKRTDKIIHIIKNHKFIYDTENIHLRRCSRLYRFARHVKENGYTVMVYK